MITPTIVQTDLYTFMDGCAPTTTGMLDETSKLAYITAAPVKSEEPRAPYMHGWNIKRRDAFPIIGPGTRSTSDALDKPTNLIQYF